eukprot:scaffold1803_cov195-Alexandrium_tamarense.AAC.21
MMHTSTIITQATSKQEHSHLYPIVHIEPLRMMPHLLRQHGNLTHELPRLIEIEKVKCLRDGISILDHLPTFAEVVGRGGWAMVSNSDMLMGDTDEYADVSVLIAGD